MAKIIKRIIKPNIAPHSPKEHPAPSKKKHVAVSWGKLRAYLAKEKVSQEEIKNLIGNTFDELFKGEISTKLMRGL